MTDKQNRFTYTDNTSASNDKIMENLHKQIVVDGCDVSGCECYSVHREGYCGWFTPCEGDSCQYKLGWALQQLKAKKRECEKLKEEMFAHFHKTGEVPTLLGFTIDDIANLVKENNTLRQYKKSKQASYEEMQERWQEAEKYSRKLENELSEAKKMLEFYQGCFAGKEGK